MNSFLPEKVSRGLIITLAILFFLVIASQVTILDAILIAIGFSLAEDLLNK